MSRHGPPRPLALPGDPWETIPGVHVIRLVAACHRVGIDITPTLARFALPVDTLRADTPVDRRTMFAWFEHVLARYPHRGLGLVFGSLVDPLDMGIVGHTVTTAGSFGHALETWLHYSHLVRPVIPTELHRDAHSVEVRFPEPEPAPYGRAFRAFWLEALVSSWASVIRTVTGSQRAITEVHCAYPDPQVPERYRVVFDCPVRFERPVTLLRFPREALDLPLRHSHDQAFRLCEAQCETLNQAMLAATSTAASVRRMLRSHLSQPMELDAAAAEMGLTGRTLRRRLADEGTTYTDVLNEVRMRTAGDYLRTTALPVGRIASLIGFADETAFSRAFKRTHATTPREFRARPQA